MNVKKRCELSPATAGATTCSRTFLASGATAVASRGVLPCSMSLIRGVVESVCRALAVVDIVAQQMERAFNFSPSLFKATTKNAQLMLLRDTISAAQYFNTYAVASSDQGRTESIMPLENRWSHASGLHDREHGVALIAKLATVS
jgi:hypothetical protein